MLSDLLKNKLLELEYLKQLSTGLLYWDKITNMPINATHHRGLIINYISTSLKDKLASEELQELIVQLDQQEKSDVEQGIIRKIKRERASFSEIPEHIYQKYNENIAEAELKWEEARSKNDYMVYAPALKELIQSYKDISYSLGYKDNPYNGLLNIHEENLTTDFLDVLFSELKEHCISIIKNNKNNKTKDFIKDQVYPDNIQESMSLDLLKIIGFNLDSGSLSSSTHPMTLATGNQDVRITTYYERDDFRPAFFTALHEGGHGVYEQNISSKLNGTYLSEVASMSLHEASARLYENNLGRSEEFLYYYFPKLQEQFPILKKTSFNDFYDLINVCTPSLIRMDADEVSYNLHIIIRYEVEKEIINNDLDIALVPKIWNEKYSEYLGITPPDDLSGVLQDVHWASGYFGYFPTYTLGNIYATQIYDMYKKSDPTWAQKIKSGNINSLTEWLSTNIYRHGAIYTTKELIEKVIKTPIDSQPYVSYLQNKYSSK